MPLRTRSGAAVLSATLLLAACADPTAPPRPTPGAIRASGGSGAGYVDVCKRAGPANIPFTFTVTSSSNVGYIRSSTFQLLVGQCTEAWIGTEAGAPVTMVTVSEIDLPSGTQLDRIEILGNPNAIFGTNSATVPGQTGVYQMIKFYNSVKPEEPPPPPPPTGAYGCTPGYWKQPQHFGNWVGYTQSQLWRDAFATNALSPRLTLLAALEDGGGGGNRFGRHSTAALLNASRLGSMYGMSTAQVIAAVQAAVAAGSTQMDALASRFEAMNERGCPLGRAE